MDVVLQDWHRALISLTRSGHTVQSSGLAPLLNETLRPLGIHATVYLVDIEQRSLHTLPEPGVVADAVPIEGSLAGRCYMTVTPLVASRDPIRFWMPLIDGTERLGVLDLTLPAGLDPDKEDVFENIDAIAGLLAHLIVAKTQYGDTLSRARRSQAMSPGAETLWRLLPPLTFTTHRLVLSAILEPCYAVGGDVYDYAVDDDIARIALFDAVGHGLPAALTATVALGASRSARIQGRGLQDVARAVDEAILGEFQDSRFLTAILAELHLATGTVHYLNAGHPPPVLLRDGKAVAQLDSGRRLPLGLQGREGDLAQISLEPATACSSTRTDSPRPETNSMSSSGSPV